MLIRRLVGIGVLLAALLSVPIPAGAIPKHVNCHVPHHNLNVNSYYLAGWCEQDVQLWFVHVTRPTRIRIERWKLTLQAAYFAGYFQRLAHDHIGRSSCQHGICGGFE